VLYTVKGPYMNKFAETDFRRGSADLYSRNLILVDQQLNSINLRVSMGASMDFDTQVDDIADMKTLSGGKVLFPPNNYFNRQLTLTALP